MSSSIPQLFLEFVSREPEASFVYVPEKKESRWAWEAMSRAASLRSVAFFARKLDSLGVSKGERVAIWANTRAEWCLIDIAVLSLGGIVVGIYPTLMKDMVLEQLKDSGASVLIVENESQVLEWEEELEQLENLIHMISIEAGEKLLPFEKRLGSEEDIEWLKEKIREREASDVASIIYTSGTTGKSKGVLLTHHNFISNLHTTKEVLPLGKKARSIVCLPLAHSLQRFVVYRGFTEDVEGYFAPSLQEIPETIQAAKPTILIAVPRMLEKIQNKILQQARERSFIAAFLVRRAIEVGWEIEYQKVNRAPTSLRLRWQWKLLRKMVVSKIRSRLGGELRQIVSGGAPLHDETAKFFWALGYQVVEGWGLSETCAPATLNMEGARKLGSVGKVLSNMELKIEPESGEILIQGEGVFSGYYKHDSSAYFENGYFKTGDIGELDRDGYLYITGRLKDIIVTAGGKNIAPQRIAQFVEGGLIHHCIVVGDQQKYLVALIALDEEVLRSLAEEKGWFGAFPDWVKQAEVDKWVEERIKQANKQLSSYEQLKNYALLPKPLTEESGLLTSTQKVKKKVVIEHYQALWSALYS